MDELLVCEDCGKAREDAKATTCPYAEEINETIINVVLCGDCHYERSMDI